MYISCIKNAISKFFIIYLSILLSHSWAFSIYANDLFTGGTHMDIMTYFYIRAVKNKPHSAAVFRAIYFWLSGFKYDCKILVVIPIADPAFPSVLLIDIVWFTIHFYDLRRESTQRIPADACCNVIIVDNMG